MKIPMNETQTALYNEAKTILRGGVEGLCRSDQESIRDRLFQLCETLAKSLKSDGVLPFLSRQMQEARKEEMEFGEVGFYEHLHPCEDLIDWITLGRLPTDEERLASFKDRMATRPDHWDPLAPVAE